MSDVICCAVFNCTVVVYTTLGLFHLVRHAALGPGPPVHATNITGRNRRNTYSCQYVTTPPTLSFSGQHPHTVTVL